MKQVVLLLSLALLWTIHIADASTRPAREFLTEEEIELIQIKQDIDPRVKTYLRAAEMRLKATEARLLGEETEPGDPLEYFTPEDMLDGYYRILDSVMSNLDNANQRAYGDGIGIQKALKELRKKTKESLRMLEFLEKLAKKQEKKELLRLIGRAMEITNGAHEGAAYALSDE